MPSLFPDAYSGQALRVSYETHDLLGTLFPEVDRHSEYREAEAWLVTQPHSRWPKNKRRFLFNWFKKTKHAAMRSEARESRIHLEAMVGTGPELPAGARMIRKGKR